MSQFETGECGRRPPPSDLRSAFSVNCARGNGPASLFDPARVGKLIKRLEGPASSSEVNNMALVGILSAQLAHKQFVDEFPAVPSYAGSPDLVIDRSRGSGESS